MRHPPLTALAAVASLLLAAAAASPAAARPHAAPHASATISSWDSPAFTHALETLGEGDADQPIAQPSLDGLADPGPAEPTSSRTVATLAVKIVDSGDNHGLPFIIVDKPSARVLVFDAKGELVGEAPALLGMARGDDAAPGIGDLEVSKIPVDERTTEAGRFLAKLGPAKGMDSVLWVDFDTSLSLHPVVTGNPKERRLQRLRSPSPDERRITHGCINVPADFYKTVVQTTFEGTAGVVYILPDTKPVETVFAQLAGG